MTRSLMTRHLLLRTGLCPPPQACQHPSRAHRIQAAELAFQFSLVGEQEGAAGAFFPPQGSWERFLEGVTADRLSPGWGWVREGAWVMGTFCLSISCQMQMACCVFSLWWGLWGA